jgi:hypothetical protein
MVAQEKQFSQAWIRTALKAVQASLLALARCCRDPLTSDVVFHGLHVLARRKHGEQRGNGGGQAALACLWHQAAEVA